MILFSAHSEGCNRLSGPNAEKAMETEMGTMKKWELGFAKGKANYCRRITMKFCQKAR